VNEVKLIAMAIVAILLIIGIDNAVGGEQPNNEPYTGLCVRPSSQGGC
jgi:hypothetical protein